MRSLPQPTHFLFWFLLALFIKGSFFLYKTVGEKTDHKNKTLNTFFAYETDDAASYFAPIENYLSSGEYGGGEFGDYRMPGYGVPYALLRFFLSPETSADILVLFQLVLASIAVYALARIAWSLSSNSRVFYWTYFLFAFSSYTSLFDHFLLTESFTVSACIFGFYFFLDKTKKRSILLSGFFFAWALFLKPICAPIFLFALFFLLRSLRNLSIGYKVRQSLLFMLPVLMFEAFWITHNYRHHQTLSPLTRTTYYPKTHDSYRKDLYDFLRSTGQTVVWWNQGTLAAYFLLTDATVSNLPDGISYAYTSQFNADSLLSIKHLIQQYETNTTQSIPTHLLANQISSRLKRYTASVRDEKPFLFYIGSRLRLTKSFLFHSGTYNLYSKPFKELSRFQQLCKIFYSGLYMAVILIGMLGSLYLIFTRQNSFLCCLSLYFSFVYPVLLQLDEYRYLVPAYPFLLVVAVLFVNKLAMKGP